MLQWVMAYSGPSMTVANEPSAPAASRLDADRFRVRPGVNAWRDRAQAQAWRIARPAAWPEARLWLLRNR